MANPQKLPIIFSDVDGTILDYIHYSYNISFPAIQKIIDKGIPLILTSSKTKSELQILSAKLGLQHPFIFENGAGIGFPDGSYKLLGKTNDELIQYKSILEAVCAPIKWVDTMPIDEIISYLGMDYTNIIYMISRLASVLFIPLHAIDVSSINHSIAQYGITISQGKKFHVLHDSSANKGIAIHTLLQTFYKEFPLSCTYGIGDGINDYEMFAAVDKAYFVGEQAVYSHIQLRCNAIIHTHSKGPHGFVEAIEDILQRHSVT